MRDTTSMSKDETISISEAARRLKVSERTIYRMMKAGKLTRQYEHDSVRLMSDEVRQFAPLQDHDLSDYVRQVSDSAPQPLHQQISEKDAQIAQLLAQQREMGQLLDRLQAQLYELTQYVLSHAQTPPSRGFEWAFWRR